MSVTASATLDIHKEEHTYKNVASNERDVEIQVAKMGYIKCGIHPGMHLFTTFIININK